MSYCRWSDNDYQCDVYCYADSGGGYTTHVASNRLVLDVELPPPVPLDKDHLKDWMLRHNRVMEWVEKAERCSIGLQYDGESFNDSNAAGAADRLQMLKESGYNVPQYAIDSLRDEAFDEANREHF